MADLVFNIAKGREAYYGSLPGTSDAIIAVPLEASGLVGDSTMVDYDTLAAVLAGASNEQSTMGRETLTGVAVTVDDGNDRVVVDADDVVWSAATGNATGALLFCYVPDTGSSTDSDIIPLSKHDFSATPAGGDITAAINSGGILRAS